MAYLLSNISTKTCWNRKTIIVEIIVGGWVVSFRFSLHAERHFVVPLFVDYEFHAAWACAVKIWLKIAINAVRLPKFEPVNGKSWSPRKMMEP